MGIVYEPVEDGIGDGGIGDGLMPGSHRELTGDDCGSRAVPVIEDLEEFLVLAILTLCYAPIIYDKDLGSGDLLKKPGKAPIGLSKGEASEEFGDIEVECPMALAACLMGQGTGHKGLTAAGGTGDYDILVVCDPVARGQLFYLGSLKSPAVPEIQILYGGGLFEAGIGKAGCQSTILLPDPLALYQHGEAFIEGELGHRGGGSLLLIGFGHATEFHLIEFGHSGLIEHIGIPFWASRPLRRETTA